MKTTLALAFAALSLAACAAPNGTEETSTDTNAATAAGEETVYRGAFEAMGNRYVLEVAVTSKQLVKQTKYCDPGSGANDPAYAGSYTTPLSLATRDGGTVRTIVRDAAGAIVGESSNAITTFSTDNYQVDVPAQCSKDGRRIVDFRPVTTFANASPLVWIPGVVVTTANGPLWINPSYGGVFPVGVSLDGAATYRSISSRATLGTRPFSQEGQEIEFEKGELTFRPTVPSLELEVGTDIDPTGSHAAARSMVTLARE